MEKRLDNKKINPYIKSIKKNGINGMINIKIYYLKEKYMLN